MVHLKKPAHHHNGKVMHDFEKGTYSIRMTNRQYVQDFVLQGKSRFVQMITVPTGEKVKITISADGFLRYQYGSNPSHYVYKKTVSESTRFRRIAHYLKGGEDRYRTGNSAEVFLGMVDKSTGGKSASAYMFNKHGKIVSKSRHANGGEALKHLRKYHGDK